LPEVGFPIPLNDRVLRLHEEVRGTPPALCAERARLVTRYFREVASRREPMILQRAGALAYLLRHKEARVYPGELLVGCFTAHRVGGGLYPELHGVAMLEDLFRFEDRKVNPLQVSRVDRRKLLTEVLPYWAPRFLALRSRPLLASLRFIAEQLAPVSHLINESGGISHFVPDYEGLLARGTTGFREEATAALTESKPGSEAAHFLRAVEVVCQGLESFAERYREVALAQAAQENDAGRRLELTQIAEVCARVPRLPARSFGEALQSLLFAQIALNLESLDNSVSPGRLDQILWPYYERDLAGGALDQAQAFELLGCFAVKLCEIVPAFSRRVTRFHGGLFNGQVVVVGGTDRHGRDATNELTLLFLELMDRLRTRQPNYHARLHQGSPPHYRARIARALAAGAVSPALYNDEVIVPVLRSRGMALEDARDYATVGCVEPVAAAKSFLSTDAALFNLGLCLELALNGGRRFGRRRRVGAATPAAERCQSIEELVQLFRTQIEFGVARMLGDLWAIEEANARWHPTPLSSMLIRGCLESARDSTAGGAVYNGSGLQGIGAVDVGDSLAAVEAVVFRDGQATSAEVIQACRSGFRDAAALRARLRAAPKFGNDDPEADRFVSQVMEVFSGALRGKMNFRGGAYVAGYYSVTAHQAFGEVVGALPSGRAAGAPFSSGISPENGFDRAGPTATLRSVSRLPFHLAQNGVNLNLALAPWLLEGPEGALRLQWLIEGGFDAGCMQMQVNVLDPRVLLEARDHPGRYPGLLVRVSGYSAYFDDLSPQMKDEFISRTVCDRT
jgi:formate C-acetyltransferase